LAAIPDRYRDTAIAYLDETPYEPGEPVPVAGRSVPAEERLRLGFVDCEAGRNWAHACLYVRCGADEVRVDAGSLPPALAGTGRRLTVLAAGPKVPAWALD
jgi:hypothetical protein